MSVNAVTESKPSINYSENEPIGDNGKEAKKGDEPKIGTAKVPGFAISDEINVMTQFSGSSVYSGFGLTWSTPYIDNNFKAWVGTGGGVFADTKNGKLSPAFHVSGGLKRNDGLGFHVSGVLHEGEAYDRVEVTPSAFTTYDFAKAAQKKLGLERVDELNLGIGIVGDDFGTMFTIGINIGKK